MALVEGDELLNGDQSIAGLIGLPHETSHIVLLGDQIGLAVLLLHFPVDVAAVEPSNVLLFEEAVLVLVQLKEELANSFDNVLLGVSLGPLNLVDSFGLSLELIDF